MDEGTLTLIFWLIPIVVLAVVIYFSYKIRYTMRLIPSLSLCIIAVLLYFLAPDLAQRNEEGTLTLIYLGITFFLASIISFFVVLFRKNRG
ncbi:MAG: hypothetical protein ACI35O_11295 [Bacillaceae bacterium]